MAIFSPVGTPVTPLPTPGEGSISPALDLSPKEINPQARELLQAEREAADPLAKYKKVEPSFFDAGGAKLIDLNAREKLGGFAEEKPTGPVPLSGYKKADALDINTVEELDADRKGFDPVTYYAENPEAPRNIKKFAKLLEVARRRYEEGLTAGGVAEAVAKETPGVVGDIPKGVRMLTEGNINMVVQPAANVILGTFAGDLFNKQRREALFSETLKIVRKGAAEAAAGAESAAVGVVDLSRMGLRKLREPTAEMVSGVFTGKKVSRQSDQEVLQQLSDDASFRQNAEDILVGQGESAKNLGLDRETLAKEGIELDPEAIRLISLVDPISMVATGGAFKLVSVSGKVLVTAKTLEGVKKVSEGIAKLAELSKKGGGRLVQGTGNLTTFTGESMKKTGTLAGVGSIIGGSGTIEGVATAAAVNLAGEGLKKIGPKIASFGKAIATGTPVSATAQRVIDFAKIPGRVAAPLVKGAATGFVAGAPFAVMADRDEVAGTLLGVGTALGAGGAAVATPFRVVQKAASRRYFGENRPPLPDIPSPGYADVPEALNAMHESQSQKLSVQDANELKHFREVLRPLGKKFLNVDGATWRAKLKEQMPNATPEQLDAFEKNTAYFDSADTVYLNGDTRGLRHDAGHLFDSVLKPEKRAELDAALLEAFGQKAIDDFQARYQDRAKGEVSRQGLLDEYRAEQFNALFHNVPLAEMNTPKGLLKKFVDIIAEGAEDLGIDVSAGATTPLVGAPVSLAIRKLFQNAAGDVIRQNLEAKAAADAPAPVSPEARAAAAKRFSETGIEAARQQAKSDPVIARAVDDVSVHMEAGNPVLEIDHLGIVSKGTPDSPEGRTSRRATQAAGYEALKGTLSRAGAPDDLVASHLKTFVPVRWTPQGGTPTLIAMSLDKVLQNIQTLGSEPKAASLIPYPTENGKLTPQGWRDAVADLKAYAENQANGRRGDGGRLTVPEAGELSIPVENPTYAPQILTPEKANFANVVQGLETPGSARAVKGKIPGNVKGQILAESNLRAVEIPADIPTTKAGKQAFIEFSPRVVQEVNPLRNRLKKAGVDTGELIEVTERIRAIDIERVTPRPDISFKAPVTDIIRGGFSPAPTEFRQKNLGGRTVEEFSDYVLKASPEEWKAATDNMTGGLTGGAWNLGLGLQKAADVAILKSYASKFSDSAKAAMVAGEFDNAMSQVSRGQFFREAFEAATGTGSAGAAFKRGAAGMESAKPPFPIEEAPPQ